MEVGVRSHETASLTVAIPTAVPVHMREGMRELLFVFTPPADRRKGYATALLAKVCDEADEHGMVLMLTVTDPPLAQFYRKFGFIELPSIAGAPVIMARQHRVSQSTVTRTIRRATLRQSISQVLH